MKYFGISLGLFALSLSSAMACDVCGMTNSAYMGALPLQTRSLVGVRGVYARAHIFADGQKMATDALLQTELWGRYVISPRWQATASLPMGHLQHTENDTTLRISGLADASAMVMFRALATDDSVRVAFRQSLVLGAGGRVPTGKTFSPEYLSSHNLPPNFQLRLGGVSAQAYLRYACAWRKWSFAADANALFPMGSRNQYFFGNRYSSSATLYFRHEQNETKVMPFAGVLAEYFDKDIILNDLKQWGYQPNSGGHGVQAFGGIEAYSGRLGGNITAYLPIYQAYAAGNVQYVGRVSASLMVLL